jgi:RsiW-degrading membrane proteinase PrsW (M82 family)
MIKNAIGKILYMEQAIVIVLLFTIVLILLKVVEYKFIDKENPKPLKMIVRDVAFGVVASFVATTIYFYNEQTICSFFNIITNGTNIVNVNPVILTGEPGF